MGTQICSETWVFAEKVANGTGIGRLKTNPSGSPRGFTVSSWN